ncbi:hypothetical protein D4E88_23905 [Salmonella enterica subsp. enterica serovar Albany]|nr:hypothetical protein [Salmonella enterica subsp. enterica serovar Albany]
MGVADEYFREYVNQGEYGVHCGFCQDIGQLYNIDFTSIYMSGEILPVEKLIEEVSFSEYFESELIEQCHSLGITEGNACISIMRETFSFSHDKNFSGLHFIGVFEFSMAEYRKLL